MAIPQDDRPGSSSPLDASAIIDQAITKGIPGEEATSLTHAILSGLNLYTQSQNSPLSCEQAISMARFIHRIECTRLEKEANPPRNGPAVDIERDLILAIISQAIEATTPKEETLPQISVRQDTRDGQNRLRYEFNQVAKDAFFDGRDPYDPLTKTMSALHITRPQPGRDILTTLCSRVELAIELGKHLHAADILNLYIASRGFRHALDGYMLSSIRAWITARCPQAGHIFPFKLYKQHLIPDPKGRTLGEMYPSITPPERQQLIRSVPGLRYLQLVLNRDRYCREIIAIMARNGHLMPPTMYSTLLRLWLLMEVGHTQHRLAMLRNRKLWRDVDLYNAQLLFVKLGLHFNDPVYGPSSYELLHLILGQKGGLFPLWQLLTRRRFTTLSEIIEAKVRYDFDLTPENWQGCLPDGGRLHGVPLWEVGAGHREGFGQGGRRHLMRPDELVPLEAVQRGLRLDSHIRHMILWGYFDWRTGENMVPTEEDMYISDEETTLAHMDTTHHWRKKHSMKKRWHELTPQQQREIREEDEDDRLRAMGWSYGADEEDDYDDDEGGGWWYADDEAEYCLDDEIERGFIVPPPPPPPPQGGDIVVPDLGDKDGWAEFVASALVGAVPDLSEEDALCAEGLGPWSTDESFDWVSWMRSQGFDIDE